MHPIGDAGDERWRDASEPNNALDWSRKPANAATSLMSRRAECMPRSWLHCCNDFNSVES